MTVFFTGDYSGTKEYTPIDFLKLLLNETQRGIIDEITVDIRSGYPQRMILDIETRGSVFLPFCTFLCTWQEYDILRNNHPKFPDASTIL